MKVFFFSLFLRPEQKTARLICFSHFQTSSNIWDNAERSNLMKNSYRFIDLFAHFQHDELIKSRFNECVSSANTWQKWWWWKRMTAKLKTLKLTLHILNKLYGNIKQAQWSCDCVSLGPVTAAVVISTEDTRHDSDYFLFFCWMHRKYKRSSLPPSFIKTLKSWSGGRLKFCLKMWSTLSSSQLVLLLSLAAVLLCSKGKNQINALYIILSSYNMNYKMRLKGLIMSCKNVFYSWMWC